MLQSSNTSGSSRTPPQSRSASCIGPGISDRPCLKFPGALFPATTRPAPNFCGERLLVLFSPASHHTVVVDGPVAARHDIAWSYTSSPSCQRRWRVRSLPIGVPRRYPGARPVSTLVILIRARPCGFLNSESDLDSCIRSRSCLQPTAQVRYCARTLISEEGGCNLAIHLCNLQHDINTQG